MGDELHSAFDVIVLGTGLPESILAAAATRAGFSVLHLDSADHYGGLWASANLDALRQLPDDVDSAAPADVPELAEEGETTHIVHKPAHITCAEHAWHVEKYEDPPQPVKDDSETKPEVVDASEIAPSKSEEKATEEVEEKPTEVVEEKKEEAEPDSPVVRLGKLRTFAEAEYRRFSLDLTPKALPSRGAMVEMLISSGVHRYAEFVLADRLLTHYEGHIRSVPMSRADVFQSQELTMLEKRKLMKFLTLAINLDPEELAPSDSEPSFLDYLELAELTPRLRHHVFAALAMGTPALRRSAGLSRVRAFLASLGRFGNSPWLWTLYGSGEMPQFFCRLAAVFGATYALARPVQAILTRNDDEGSPSVSAIVSGGQRIACRWLVADAAFLPASVVEQRRVRLRRAVLLTDASLLPPKQGQKDNVSVFPWNSEGASIRCLELPPNSMCSPKGIFVMHLTEVWCGEEKKGESPKDFFRSFVDEFLGGGVGRPQLLWSFFFAAEGGICEQTPLANLAVTNPPSADFDYADVVAQTKQIFQRLWPDSEFLPPVPEIEEEERTFEVSNGFVREETKTAAEGAAEVADDEEKYASEEADVPSLESVDQNSDQHTS